MGLTGPELLATGAIRSRASGVRVLCVDDNASYLELLAASLETRSDSMSVLTATSATDGLDVLEREPVDCVLSDYRMPGLDGLELLEAVREEDPDLPFILVTGEWTDANAQDAIDAGATDYVEKRWSEEQHVLLTNRIESAVARYRARRDASTYSEVLAGAVDALEDPFYLFDPTGEFLLWNDACRRVTGYSDAEIAEMAPMDFFEGGDADRVAEAIGRVLDEGRAMVEADIQTANGKRVPYEFTGTRLTDAGGDLIGICGIGRDVSARKHRLQQLRERERLLTALHAATRSLVRAESKDEVATLSVRVASEVLELPMVAVYLFEEPTNELRPAAWAPGVEEVLGELEPFGPDEALAWDAFVDGERRVYEDLSGVEGTHNPQTPVRSELIVPLADHGVLVAGDTDPGVFDDLTIEFADLFALTVGAALDAVEQEAELQDHEKRLDDQTERLNRQNRINAVIRDIDRLLVDASTRREFERGVCEHLLEVDSHDFAWIGMPTDEDGVFVRAWAGDDRAREWVADGRAPVVDQAEAAMRAREPQVVSNLLDGGDAAPWRSLALSGGYRSVLTVPISYGGAVYGTLQVFATTVDAFDAETRSVLGELGETIGHTESAIDRRDALVTDASIRLVLRIRHVENFFVQVAREIDDRVEMRRVRPHDEGVAVSFTVADAAPDRVIDLAEDRPRIQDITPVPDTGDAHLYEGRVTGETMVTTLAEFGGQPRSLVATPDGSRVAVDLPRSADVRTVVDALKSAYPGAEFVARRTVDPHDIERIPERFVERLTDRQREALEVAHEAGFFEWPRGESGEEVAERLDISPSTFHQHIRAAERKLFETVFDPDP